MNGRRTISAVVAAVALLSALPAVAAITIGHRSAATPPVVSDAFDARLASAGTDPLLAYVHAADIATAQRAVETAGLSLVDRFEKIGVAVALGRASEILAVADLPGVTKVQPADTPISFSLDSSHQATRGEEARQGFDVTQTVTTPAVPKKNGKPGKPAKTVTTTTQVAGVDGTGVSIAIIDSGIDGTHPLFQVDGASKVVRNLRLNPICPVRFVQDELPLPCSMNSTLDVFTDVPTNDSDTLASGGHGTHVAGIAGGGDGEAAGKPLHGAAPGAKLIGLSVGEALVVYGADAALNWVLENHELPCGAGVPAAVCPPIKVTNNSYGPGGGGEFAEDEVTVKLQRLLVEEGVVSVWAAGNDGGNGGTNLSNPPGQDPTPGILMAANYDDEGTGTRAGTWHPSSSRGDRNRPDTWPDVAAPGTAITSSCRAYLPVCHLGEGEVDADYFSLSGTSMAAPHVAGIVAQLFEANPAATPAQIEDALEDTANPFSFGAAYFADPRNPDHKSSYDKGHGLVDVVGAVTRLKGLTIASTNAPTVACDGPLVTDLTGDAVGPMTDLTGMEIAGDANGITLTISVDDLTAAYPDGENGIFFDANVDANGGSFYFGAQRSMFGGVFPVDPAATPTAEGTSFTLGHREGNILTSYASLDGAFDLDTDEITISMAPADVAEANVAIDEANAQPNAVQQPQFPVLDASPRLAGITLNSNTAKDAAAGSLSTPDDTAAATCDYVVGTGAVGPAAPAPPPPPPPPPPPGSGDASLPNDGTFTAQGVSPAENIEYTCTGPNDPLCVTYVLDLTRAGTLAISVTTDIPVEDYDLVVYNWNNENVGGVGNPGTLIESAEIADLPAGTYYLVVVPYLATEGSPFTVTASLS